ncbi:ABC transporter substrate-binding protein [Weissella confusa]|uniref:Zinc ABC transporter solute-binding protein n=1 Tax=Weissella confusa TaxID=1583 RepID=A0AAJ2YVV0_WEICO|nr:zinc ABC transporter substrate-binding protein [Weissella confusa]MBJ7693734.1 zinc ABC transporter solute-binding protein [Weissella confusa]NBA10687.1 zinc ABC transporter solute-binding protein [Weissella confusa]QBZ03831.1 ABC transporter substrate-binding protein [Weissella confusa]
MSNKKHPWLLAIPAVAVVGMIGTVIWTSVNRTEKTNQTGKIKVVASLDSYGEMAKAVLGNQGSVTSIMDDPDMDPHEFEPTSADAKIYQKANVIISNGGGFDNWSVNFAKQNNDAQAINLAKLYDFEGEHDHNEAEEHDHDEDSAGNEHFWYKTDVATRLSKQLVKTYSKLEPSKQAYFQKNADKYLATLDDVKQMQQQVKQDLQGKNVMATEPVFDNTLIDLGANVLNQSFSKAVNEHQDPTPEDIRNWNAAIDAGEVSVVIYNPQSTGKLAKQAMTYAKEHGVPVVQATETKPAGKTYAEWQYDQLKALDEALKK